MISLLTLTTLAVAQAAAAPPKVIILMLGDDYGYNNVGFAHGPKGSDFGHGNPEMRTPHMDALARDGVVLDRFYTYKYCSPTRSSLLSGRLPPHVNQNNLNNDIEAKSGPDLRFALLPAKMKEAGYYTAMVGKSHLGARSAANLPINRGFDYHFGFLKGGEDHYSQGSGDNHFPGQKGTVDLWSGHALSNETGIYSGYLYADKAVGVIERFAATQKRPEVGIERDADADRSASDGDTPRDDAVDTSTAGASAAAPTGLFMYLAWHNTHTPLECPAEWMFPSLPAYNNSYGPRMTYNCVSLPETAPPCSPTLSTLQTLYSYPHPGNLFHLSHPRKLVHSIHPFTASPTLGPPFPTLTTAPLLHLPNTRPRYAHHPHPLIHPPLPPIHSITLS